MGVLKKIKIFSYKLGGFIKYFLCFFCVLFFIFFIGLSAQAADVLDIDQPTSTNFLDFNQFPTFGQRFVADQNNISKIYIYSHIGNATVVICKGIPADTSPADLTTNGSTCNYPGNTLIRSESITDTIIPGDYSFSSPVGLDIGSDYWFYFYNNDYQGMNGLYWNNNYGGLVIGGEPNASGLAFKTYYSDSYVPVLPWAINPIIPLTHQTIASSSVNFIISYTKPYARYDNVRIIVYDYPGSNIIFSDEQSLYNTSGYYTWKFPLPYGEYYWSADLFCYDYGDCSPLGDVYSTTNEFFLVNKNYTAPPDINICAGVATSTFFGGVECGLKKAIFWAVSPDPDTVNDLNLSYEKVKKAFPFSAFFGLTDAIILSATSSMASTTSGTLKMPFIDVSGDFLMLDILTASSVPNLIGQTNATLFRNSISWFLWLAAAFFIFLTFKKI